MEKETEREGEAERKRERGEAMCRWRQRWERCNYKPRDLGPPELEEAGRTLL